MRLTATFQFFIQFLLLPSALLGISHSVSGADEPDDRFTYTIQSTTEKITIDGLLSESVWDHLPVISDFWMSYPVDDQRVEDRLQTEVRVTSDKDFLYISAVCYGPGK